MDRWVVPIDRASKNKDMTAKQLSEIAALSPTLKYLLVKAFACKAKCYINSLTAVAYFVAYQAVIDQGLRRPRHSA
jgi:hypothetical protein